MPRGKIKDANLKDWKNNNNHTLSQKFSKDPKRCQADMPEVAVYSLYTIYYIAKNQKLQSFITIDCKKNLKTIAKSSTMLPIAIMSWQSGLLWFNLETLDIRRETQQIR